MKARPPIKELTASAIAAADEAREPLFQDWAHFVSFQPRLYFRPQDLDELKRFLAGVQQGFFKAGQLHVLGGLHSCWDICVSDAIVDVSDLPQPFEFNADHTLVSVSANWHLHDFLLALSEHGKSVSATGDTDHQTLAGLISTTTAPARIRHRLYDLLEWVEYLRMDEASQPVVEHRVSKTVSTFPAVIGSLGAIALAIQAAR